MLGTWKAGLSALRKNGVYLIDIDNSRQSYPVQATSNPNDCRGVRSALVLVKSWQTKRVASQLASCLDSQGLAVSMQNGIGNRELLVNELGANRVALGVTTTGATLLGPGKVRASGKGVISLEAHAKLKPTASYLQKAGFVVENAPDASGLLWGKLVINAAINPLTALLEVPNGALLESKNAPILMASVAREAAAVAVAQGIRLPYPDPVIAAETIARNTATNYSSMLQDVRRGAPTEIDAICGAIVRAGESFDIPTPINRTLFQLIKAKTQLAQDR
jgi:2-dehydropantoate 2-reductase